jgi:solute carrier family 25 carnitine/acylcarnitine transporter 20/29
MLLCRYGFGERWGKRLAAESDGPNATASLLPVMAGGVAGGVLQSFVVSPMELMKIRQQTIGGSLAATAQSIRAGIGAPALWRGLNATLMRDGMPHGVW